MRPIRLSPALAAAVTAVALVPTSASAAGALARLHPNRHVGPGGCRVTAFEEPARITSGESVTLFGELVCPRGGSTVSGQPVTVYQRTARGTTFTAVATGTTAEHGFFEVPVPSVTESSYFYVTALGAPSAVRRVRVAPAVTLSLQGPANTQLLTGFRHRVTFTISTPKEDEGATVLLQREFSAGSEVWRTIQSGFVPVGSGGNPTINFTITHTFTFPGYASLRVVIRPHRFLAAGISEPVFYTVSQAQNPRLTINSSARPVQYGQPLTISGVLDEGKPEGTNQTVTLLSHARETPPFTQVTMTKTNGKGEYSFVIPSATVNSAYRVTSGSIGSAELWEGVSYILTAGASATSVEAGQPVTFSGTVTPIHVGHVVYLERENPSHKGFHVVDLGSVASNGTYSISHDLWGRGTQSYRVRIPGDPENAMAWSSTFPIEVKPGNPLALRPGKEGKLPSEGQV